MQCVNMPQWNKQKHFEKYTPDPKRKHSQHEIQYHLSLVIIQDNSFGNVYGEDLSRNSSILCTHNPYDSSSLTLLAKWSSEVVHTVADNGGAVTCALSRKTWTFVVTVLWNKYTISKGNLCWILGLNSCEVTICLSAGQARQHGYLCVTLLQRHWTLLIIWVNAFPCLDSLIYVPNLRDTCLSG